MIHHPTSKFIFANHDQYGHDLQPLEGAVRGGPCRPLALHRRDELVFARQSRRSPGPFTSSSTTASSASRGRGGSTRAIDLEVTDAGLEMPACHRLTGIADFQDWLLSELHRGRAALASPTR